MAWYTILVSLVFLVAMCSGFLEDEGYNKTLEFCGYGGECNTTVISSTKSAKFSTCYKVTFGKLSFEDAKKNCSNKGGKLAEIDDEATLEFIQTSGRKMRFVQDITAWLGGREDRNGRWYWDRPDYPLINVDNWSPIQEVKSKRKHCLFTSFLTGYWFDFDCSYKNYFICEKTDDRPCELWYD